MNEVTIYKKKKEKKLDYEDILKMAFLNDTEVLLDLIPELQDQQYYTGHLERLFMTDDWIELFEIIKDDFDQFAEEVLKQVNLSSYWMDKSGTVCIEAWNPAQADFGFEALKEKEVKYYAKFIQGG